MGTGDLSGKTMRIDIHPDFLSESLSWQKGVAGPKKKGHPVVTFVRRAKRAGRSAEYVKLLESIYDAVLIADLDGTITDCNSRALDFFFCREANILGTNIIRMISGADAALLASIVRNLRENRSTLIDAYCVRRDNSLFAAEIAAKEIELDHKGRLCFFVRDVTVRKKAQEALEEAVKQLEAHDRARLQFISNISHELRTPLTSMIYAVRNMLRGVTGPVPEPVRAYLELLNGDCKRLLNTVNDILDLRKIDGRTLTLMKTRIPFIRLVRHSAEALQIQAAQKSQTLTVETGDSRCFVECDSEKIGRVIVNVIGNAVKFTPEGGEIHVSVAETGGDNGQVRLTVRDTGMGIPAWALSRVTERYFTLGEQASGTGLGLAIAKEILELHAGAIRIESPPAGRESGTAVHVELPRVAPPRVLIVEDEIAVLNLLDRQLAQYGYGVLRAMDGNEALRMIEAEKPDLVVLDIVLPGMEGTDVVLRTKSERHLRQIPIIVVTGAQLGRAKTEILRSFSIPVLRKPCEESELLDRIEESLLGAAALSGRT